MQKIKNKTNFIQFNEHRSPPLEDALVIDAVIELVGGFPTTNWCKISLELFVDGCEGKLTNERRRRKNELYLHNKILNFNTI